MSASSNLNSLEFQIKGCFFQFAGHSQMNEDCKLMMVFAHIRKHILNLYMFYPDMKLNEPHHVISNNVAF